MVIDVSELAPNERRLIVVASDKKYKELTSRINYARVLPFSITGIGITTGVLVSGSYLYATFSKNRELLKKRDKAVKGIKKFFTQNELPFLHISEDKALKYFTFDMGHPIDGAAYVLNPVSDTHYIAPATVAERFAREKMGAFHKIMATLGAKKVEIISVTAIGKKIKGRGSLQNAGQQVGLEGYVDKENAIHRRVFAEYTEPSKEPFVPDEMMVWRKTEPEFDTVIHNRIEAGLLRFTVALSFTNRMGINAKLCGTIKGCGISIGGEYQEFQESAWSFDIEFWPK